MRINRDKYENFFIILSALNEDDGLTTYKIAWKLYGQHARRSTTRTKYFLMQLYSIDAVTGYDTEQAEIWNITTRGRAFLVLYRRMLKLFPNEFKGQGVRELEMKHAEKQAQTQTQNQKIEVAA